MLVAPIVHLPSLTGSNRLLYTAPIGSKLLRVTVQSRQQDLLILVLCCAYVVVLSFQFGLERLNEISCLYARLLEAFDDGGIDFGIAEGRKLTSPVVSTVETMRKRSLIDISIVGKVGRLVSVCRPGSGMGHLASRRKIV